MIDTSIKVKRCYFKENEIFEKLMGQLLCEKKQDMIDFREIGQQVDDSERRTVNLCAVRRGDFYARGWN